MEEKQKAALKKALAKYSKQEFSELLLTLMIGVYVRTAVLDITGNEWFFVEEQVDDFLTVAEELGYRDLTENYKGRRLPSKKLMKKEEAIIEEFTDTEFWNELELRLGQRDFFESLSTKEQQEIEKEYLLPEKVHEFYDKYEAEFEEHGIDRLEIVDSAKKPN